MTDVYLMFGTRPPNNTPKTRPRRGSKPWPTKEVEGVLWALHPTKGWRKVASQERMIVANMSLRQRLGVMVDTVKKGIQR